MAGSFLSILKILIDLYFGNDPLCGTLDTRPLIFRLHYFYYAIILFSFTLLITIFTSLVTKPLEKYRLIRTTFWTRKIKTNRPDENNEITNSFELNVSVINDHPEYIYSIENNSPNTTLLESSKKNIFKKIFNYCFGIETFRSKSINKTKFELFILNLNLVIVISISVGIFIFFSIPIH